MMPHQVLVTGADGFIGSHLVEGLVTRGHKVKALTMYNSFGTWGWLDSVPKEVLDQVEVVPGDIRDSIFVRHAMKGCSDVMHLAALIAIPYSYVAPEAYIDTNVKGTLNILQAAREASVEKVIHTSTSEVYGTARFVPITEDHPLQGQSPYSASKIAADQLAYSFYSSFELPVITIRPFNTYGPRQSARAVIPTIISQIASGASAIHLGSTSPTRDFNFVADTVNGFISALSSEKAFGETINLGSGFEISVGDTVELIAQLMNAEVTVTTDEARLRPIGSEVERLCADNQKAAQLLNWSPAASGIDGLKSGLMETIQWFQKPENLSLYKTNLYNV
jgi:NAD dependent epimerase/dehydratase